MRSIQCSVLEEMKKGVEMEDVFISRKNYIQLNKQQFHPHKCKNVSKIIGN
jgi:nucleosome binding factor SPN SPT16 subunit